MYSQSVPPRIFVSSTSNDLKGCREEVCALLRALGLIDIAMEWWPAQARPPIKVVRQALADSDIYLGILAWRYGSPATRTKKSYRGVMPRMSMTITSRAL